ncbi:MAG: peptide MFS transporter, partial [Thermoanaerobaculia bacterium]
INIGAFAAPIICGWLGERVDWHLGFGAAGLGMVFGLIQYVRGYKYLGDAGLPPPPSAETTKARRGLVIGVVLTLVAIAAVVALARAGVIAITATGFSNSFGVLLLGLTAAFFVWLLTRPYWSPVERKRLIAIVILFVAASFFWGAYEQAGSSLNLFARDQTDRVVMGSEFPASWFQWVPALFVIIQAPIFAWLWVRMGKRQPSSPAKFSFGLLFVGLGFVVMIFAAMLSRGGALVGPGWLLATYFLHVVGEMFLSPVGLSTVTKLAPARVTSLMMGVWFLASAVGNYLGGRTAGLYETLPLWQLFGLVAATAIGGGLVLALLIRPIRRLMSGVH